MTRAGGETFEYDANGNVTETSSEKLPTAAVRVAYTSFHKPSRITAGGTAWKVGYDAFQQRVVKSTTERRVVTVGEHFQEERSPGGRQQRFYLTNGERVVAVATREDGDGEPKWGLTYQHHDHLGSPVATTTRTGEVSARHSFSPFGERRDPSDWRSRPPPGPPAGDVGRGFTFHEEDVVGWLNTKGRLYSPRHGRFLQADPTLPEVHLTQGGHRYSYVGNNPVNAVDPFGYQAAGNRDAEGADFPEGSKNQPIETVWVFGVRPGAAEPARAAGDGGTDSGRAADVAAANGPGGGTGAIGSTFGDEALARFDSNADAVVALGTVFAEHPVTSTAIAVPAIGFSPLWAGPAVAVGLVVTGTDAADAYRRGGLGGLSGFAAGEVGFQVGFGKAVGLAGEGVAVASRGIARAAGVALRYGEAMLPALRATGTRAADVLQKAALAPMWFAVGAGGGGVGGRTAGGAVGGGALSGEFSVVDWKGYPSGVARPSGPFRLLNGAEYDAARAAANRANAGLRAADAARYVGKQIHEIHPVKFGGSPTDPANKVALTPAEHAQYTTFWNRLMRDLQ